MNYTLRFKDISIQNFMSVGDAYLNFQEGEIFEVLGTNLDSPSGSSNGAGKSTVFNAIYQCLFNNNPSNSDLKLINNIQTSQPYTIEINLECKIGEVNIVNDRKSNTILVTVNGEEYTRKIKESLDFIKNSVLEMDYSHFLRLTYVDSDSLESILSITSNNFLLKVFNLDSLEKHKSKLTESRRELKREVAYLSAKVKSYDSKSEKSKDVSQGEVEALEHEIKEYKDKIKIHKDETQYEKAHLELEELKRKVNSYELGVCSECGQDVTHLYEDNLIKNKEALERAVKHSEKILDGYYNNISNLVSKLSATKSKLLIKEAVSEATKEDIEELNLKIQEATRKITSLNDAISVIDSGKVQKLYLSQYIRILNKSLTKNCSYGFSISASMDSSSIKYSINTDGQPKKYSQLSGGEMTVSCIIILKSILESLYEYSGINISFIVLDEAIHKTDHNNSRFISDLIKDINKSTFIIQQRDEISPSIFSKSIEVIKESGVSYIGGIDEVNSR